MQTESSSSQVTSSESEKMQVTLSGVTLPEIEGLVLPDEKRIAQWNSRVSASHHLRPDYLYPVNYDPQVGREKSLYVDGVGWTEEYFIIQALYRKVFEAYLNDLLELESYEYLFHEYEAMPLIIAPDYIKNYYWYGSTLNMECFYLRNTLCVERLDEADLAVLLRYHERGEYDVTAELTGLVERTFPTVVRVNPQADIVEPGQEPDYSIHNYFYYPSGGMKAANRNAIVFEIAYFRDHSLYTSAEFGERDTYWYENIELFLQEELQKKMPDYPIAVFGQRYLQRASDSE